MLDANALEFEVREQVVERELHAVTDLVEQHRAEFDGTLA
jgi:hypothetical protein